jgi:hypothetical protein
MKWKAISGSWRNTSKTVEEDVRKAVREIFQGGYGMASGGALGVDYIATDEALILNPEAERIRIFLPTNLDIYRRHYLKRTKEGIITLKQAGTLIGQLEKLVKINRDSVIENPKNKEVNKNTYYERISKIINLADELIVFHVNNSLGVQYTIDLARKKGIPLKILTYSIKN